MPTIVLESEDEVRFEVDIEVVKMLKTINNMLEDLGIGTDDEETVPVKTVHSTILAKVLEWAKYHKDDQPVENEEESKSKDLPAWDQEFFKLDKITLFALLNAANYLDIRGLLNGASQTIANMIKGKSPEKIRAEFNIENDFLPEEEEEIRKENGWCEVRW